MTGQCPLVLEQRQSNFHVPDSGSDNPKYYHVAAAVGSPRRQEEDLAKNDLQKEKEFFGTFVMSQPPVPVQPAVNTTGTGKKVPEDDHYKCPLKSFPFSSLASSFLFSQIILLY